MREDPLFYDLEKQLRDMERQLDQTMTLSVDLGLGEAAAGHGAAAGPDDDSLLF